MAGGVAPWAPVAVVSCVESACTCLILVAILGHLVSEELEPLAATAYMVATLLLCAAVLVLWPSIADLQASGVKATEDSAACMPWAKVLGFLFLTGWMPVLLADRAVEYNLISASHKMSVWLRSILMYLLDLSTFAVWEGATESVGIAGNQPIAGAPVASWAATIFLWLTISVIVGVYNFTHLLPGTDAAVIDTLGAGPRLVYRIGLILWTWSYVLVLATPPGGRADCSKKLAELPCSDVFYCDMCKDRRPHRCHHCNKCGTCVLRMDHHCPWLRRCIGFKNYKYFFVLVAYSTFMLLFKATTFTPYTAALFQKGAPFGTCFLLVFVETVVGFMALLLLAFLIFHVYLVSKAMTTVEFLASSRKASRKYDYDQGIYKNFQAALGTNPLFWLLPIFPPPGDGTTFPHTCFVHEPAPRARSTKPKSPECREDPSLTTPGGGSYSRLGQEDLVATVSFTGERPSGRISLLSREISQGLSNRLRKSMVQGVDESEDEGEIDAADTAEELQPIRPKLTLIHV